MKNQISATERYRSLQENLLPKDEATENQNLLGKIMKQVMTGQDVDEKELQLLTSSKEWQDVVSGLNTCLMNAFNNIPFIRQHLFAQQRISEELNFSTLKAIRNTNRAFEKPEFDGFDELDAEVIG